MEPKLVVIQEKKLAGKRLTMSFAENRTPELWRNFMPGRRGITDSVGADLYSVEVYPPNYFDRFNPETQFEKWAAVEVANVDNLPEDLETLTIPAGLYAVFVHRGTAADAVGIYRGIFGSWMPSSGYAVDGRPHFAVMGEKYKNDSADSEEEIWIPVKNM